MTRKQLSGTFFLIFALHCAAAPLPPGKKTPYLVIQFEFQGKPYVHYRDGGDSKADPGPVELKPATIQWATRQLMLDHHRPDVERNVKAQDIRILAVEQFHNLDDAIHRHAQLEAAGAAYWMSSCRPRPAPGKPSAELTGPSRIRPEDRKAVFRIETSNIDPAVVTGVLWTFSYKDRDDTWRKGTPIRCRGLEPLTAAAGTSQKPSLDEWFQIARARKQDLDLRIQAQVLGRFEAVLATSEPILLTVSIEPAPIDSFNEWYYNFSRLLNDRLARVNDARARAASIALPLHHARTRHQRLVKVLQDAASALAAGEPTASKEALDRLTEKCRLEAEECAECKRRLEAAIADARSAMDDVTRELDRGFDRFAKDNLPMWIRWQRHYEEIAKAVPFDMALAAGEHERLLAEVEKSEAEVMPVSVRVRMGREMLARGELAHAIHTLRIALRVDATNTQARDLLARAEAAAIRISMRKSAGALGQARASFNKLVDAAGYADRPLKPADWLPDITPDAVRYGFGAVDWLFVEGFERISHTPVNIWDSYEGRTQAEARKLDAQEMEMADNFLALPVVLRLREKGYTLDQIAGMDASTLRKSIPLKTAAGQPYSQAQLARLSVAIHKAMMFEDIAALRNPDLDLDQLKRALDKPYFHPSEWADTWVDEFGSVLIEQALLLALPMAQVTKGGKTVTELLGYITRYEKAVQWFGGTQRGQRMLQSLKQYQTLQETLWHAGNLGKAKMLGLKGAELMALFVLQGYTCRLADEYGGEAAALVTSALVMMVTDLDLLTRWLEAGNIPRALALRVMDTAIRQGEQAIEQMDLSAASLSRLRDIRARKAAGGTISADDARFLAMHQSVPSDFIPSGDCVNDAKLAASRLADEARAGADASAAGVCRKFEDDIARGRSKLAEQSRKAKAARESLAQAKSPTLPPTGGGTVQMAPRQWGTYRIPPAPMAGSTWAQAEKAMRDRQFQKARQLYQRAFDEGELTEELFRAFEQRALEALRARKLPLRSPQPTFAEFTPGQVDDILLKRWNQRTPLKRADATPFSDVFEYSDASGSYILKELKLGDKVGSSEEDLCRFIDSALVSSRLMDALGIPNARIAATIVRDPRGDATAARFLIRKIDGHTLAELSSGELFLYGKELSEQRAFALLIGDHDRKLANAMLGEDGLLRYIDPDLARLRATDGADPFFMEGLGGLDHWYVRSADDMHKYAAQTSRETTLFYERSTRAHLAERALTINDAQPMVDRITRLLDPANEANLKDLLARAYREARGHQLTDKSLEMLVEQTIATLRARGRRLPEVLHHLNQRNGIAPPTPSGMLPLQLFPQSQSAVASVRVVGQVLAA